MNAARFAGVVALAATLAASTAVADVTVTDKTSLDGFGAKGYGASEGTGTVVVSGDKLRQETTTKFTGKFMKRFGGEDGIKGVTITRLDRRLNYTVDYDKKTYQEVPFANLQQMREQLQEAAAPPEPEGEAAPPEIECDPVRVAAKATGEKRAIAGFDAEEVRITGTQTCKAKDSGATCTMYYALTVWNTANSGPFKELQDFYRLQAEAMGLDLQQMQAVANASKALVAQGTQGMESVYKELAKVGGYPVSTRFVVEKEGTCGAGGSPGEPGTPDVSNMVKGIGGSLKGMFGKKGKAQPAEDDAKAPAPAAPAARTKMFGMSHELVAISATGAAADLFEPPPGFKKVDPPKPPKPTPKP